MTLAFNEEKHEYLVDGRPAPSVTELVAPLGEDYDDLDEYMELAVDYAAERGTALHAYIAHRLTGGAPEDFELPTAYEGYAESVELFLAEHRIEPILIETALCCSQYAGTPDLVCDFDGTLTILDYKFVSQVAKSKVGAQLGGYLSLCEENGLEPQKLAAVQFLPEGEGYRLYPADKASAVAAFTACLAVYGWKKTQHKRGRIFK